MKSNVLDLNPNFVSYDRVFKLDLQEILILENTNLYFRFFFKF